MKGRLHILAFCILLLPLFVLSSCSKDEATKMYSTKYAVFCSFYVPTYTQLFNAVGSYGEFATIRQKTNGGVSVIEMNSNLGSGQYAIDKTMQYFSYGLGGLIVGTSYYGETLAYDLACPSCDRADRRLVIGDAGIVKCPKCGISYDMNNYGVISSVPSNPIHESPRGLYRYRVMYDGTNLRIYNK